MHQRGDVFQGTYKVGVRGSVWVEQEIAIAALMTHVLGRHIPVLFYVQRGVGIEGIRQVLQLNPKVEFTEEHEVLEDLRNVLPSLTVRPFAEYDLTATISYEGLGGDASARHDYQLCATVENTGQQAITDFRLEVHFPSRFLNTNVTFAAVENKTDTHWCFVTDHRKQHHSMPLYSGQKIRLTIPYHVDNNLFRNALSDKILVNLFSRDMTPKKSEYEIREFQFF